MLTDEYESYTYQQIFDSANRIAKHLYSFGIRPGDRVAVFLNNCLEYVQIIFALARLGAVEVPMNVRSGGDAFQHIIQQSECTMLITKSDFPFSVIENNVSLKKIIVLGDCFPASATYVSWEDMLKQDPKNTWYNLDEICPIPNDARSICCIMYTSGSTSNPKGVILTHDMLLRNAYGSCVHRCIEFGRRIYVPLPLFHMFAYLEGLLTAILVGGSIILSKEKFSADNALKIIKEHCPDDILCLPTMMAEILSNPHFKKETVSSLHAVFCSGSDGQKQIYRDIRNKLDINDVVRAYGMTEVASSTIMVSPMDPLEKLETTLGSIKLSGCAGLEEYNGNQIEYRVVDPESGKELSPGQAGELQCRGATVTPGYYNEPQINAEAFDECGWFKTGDIGYFDSDGYLVFVGRKDDMYRINGENVSPLFVDKVIGRCEQVVAVETVGIPHPKCGAIGVAFIHPKSFSEEIYIEIEMFCRSNLTRYQVPKYVIYSDSKGWPRTSVGKIKKKLLRKLAMENLSTGKFMRII